MLIFPIRYLVEPLSCQSLDGSLFSQEAGKKPLLPSGPEGPVPFGAYDTRLDYIPEWDRLWPVSDVADVVVRFEGAEPRFVFWRGTSYVPCWATFSGAWFTNEFFERRGGPASGTTSMVEPMSDKQCRYSNVRILENNQARVVIHWRYAPVDLDYSMAYVDPETRWGDWADEYYYLYPDAVGIRQATLYTSAPQEWIEYQESIVINQPGTIPENNIQYDALTLANLKGESKTYTWTEDGSPGLENPPVDACIQTVNFKSSYKPFSIVNPDEASFNSYRGHAPGSQFNFWNHWPVAQEKSDTQVAQSADRPSHSSLSQIKWKPYAHDSQSQTWIMMHGMTQRDAAALVPLAKSWLCPAKLELLSDKFSFESYDPCQRAYLLIKRKDADARELKFELLATAESPVFNPVFVIKNWGAHVQVRVNGESIERGENFRYGWRNTLEGQDLIVWIKLESSRTVQIVLAECREP
jgi:hypothetical protein